MAFMLIIQPEASLKIAWKLISAFKNHAPSHILKSTGKTFNLPNLINEIYTSQTDCHDANGSLQFLNPKRCYTQAVTLTNAA